jgi:hypothetical protein
MRISCERMKTKTRPSSTRCCSSRSNSRYIIISTTRLLYADDLPVKNCEGTSATFGICGWGNFVTLLLPSLLDREESCVLLGLERPGHLPCNFYSESHKSDVTYNGFSFFFTCASRIFFFACVMRQRLHNPARSHISKPYGERDVAYWKWAHLSKVRSVS